MKKLVAGLLIAVMASWDVSFGLAKSELTEKIYQLLPRTEEVSLQPAPIKGWYQVNYGPDVFYVSEDGKYLFNGDLLALNKEKFNYTEAARNKLRITVLKNYPGLDLQKDTVVYAPPKTRHVVYVFTDIDCPYCRMLHNQVPEFNKRGIEIRYLAFPRAGFGSDSYYKDLQIWCSKNRNQAFDEAMRDSNFKFDKQECANNPLPKFMQLVKELRLNGTPALLLPDGQLLPGYVTAEQLEKLLDEQKTK